LGLLVAGVDTPRVSRNEYPPPQPLAAPAPTPSLPSCRSFRPSSDPIGFEVDPQPLSLDQAPSWADLLLASVFGGASSPVVSSAIFDSTSPSQQPSTMELTFSADWLRPLYLFVRAAFPWDPGASYFIYLRRHFNHIFRSPVRSSNCGFTGPPLTDAARGLHLGARVLDASAFPPPGAPSTASPWASPSSDLCFKAFYVIWSSSEDLYVIRLL
jgi:hypothetical protein